MSRAEELKAIVSSSNQALLRQDTSVQGLLRGRLQFHLDRETEVGFLWKKQQAAPFTVSLYSHIRDGP